MFEEKSTIDNQTIPFNGDIVSGDCGLTFDSTKKVLIASRHLRNDSKSIQLELRYDNYTVPDGKEHNKKSKKHIRSNSCDVKIVRSNSREYDNEYKLKKASAVASHQHSRNNSRDLNETEFRQKLTHTRNNSRDDHSSNIKFILNYLNTSKLAEPISRTAAKKHSRNHSYDQIYMPNNIKIDHEFNKKFKKNLSRKNSKDYDNINILKNNTNNKDYLDNKFTAIRKNSKDLNDDSNLFDVKYQHHQNHTRTNSKDLNLNKNNNLSSAAATASSATGTLIAPVLLDETMLVSANSVLRHRRTSSKDLGRVPVPDTGKHIRNSSQHKIQIDDPSEYLLLRRNSQEPAHCSSTIVETSSIDLVDK